MAQRAKVRRLTAAKGRRPREMRHSFVSLLSDPAARWGISPAWSATATPSVTETIYPKQLRPMLLEGAEAMDRLLPD